MSSRPIDPWDAQIPGDHAVITGLGLAAVLILRTFTTELCLHRYLLPLFVDPRPYPAA